MREEPRREYVPFEKTVTEKKAPTDESIRLLNEMEATARRNIISKIIVSENWLDGVGIAFRQDFPMDCFVYHFKFTLNGREYFSETIINRKDIKWHHEDYLRDTLRQKLSNIIAEALLHQLPERK